MHILAYLDDNYVLGPPDKAAAATAMLRKELGKINLELNTDKCKAWSPSGNFGKLADAGAVGFALELCVSGLKVLGVFMGSSAASRILGALTDTSKDKSLVNKVECLKEFAKAGFDHYALALLLCCAAPSVNYVLRAADPTVVGETADKADELLVGALGDITGVSSHELRPGSRARTQRQKEGGFGLSSAAERAKCAYLGSWAAFGPSVAARFPHLAADIAALGGEGEHPHAYGRTVKAQLQYCADTLELDVAHITFQQPAPRWQRTCGSAEARRAKEQVEHAVQQHAAAGGHTRGSSRRGSRAWSATAAPHSWPRRPCAGPRRCAARSCSSLYAGCSGWSCQGLPGTSAAAARSWTRTATTPTRARTKTASGTGATRTSTRRVSSRPHGRPSCPLLSKQSH